MRTTVTLDEDVAAALQEVAGRRGLSFKEALNTTLRAGLASTSGASRPYRVPARAMGLRAGVDVDKALRLAAALEDDEVLRELAMRK